MFLVNEKGLYDEACNKKKLNTAQKAQITVTENPLPLWRAKVAKGFPT
jgi:hypothetical protein